MSIWTKNNKLIVDNNGHVVVCNECPCGSVECEDAVDSEVQRLLALVDEHGHNVWSLQGTYEPPYRCAEWHYDSENEEWVLDHMAEGKLAVALRVGTKVSHTTDAPARYLVYAKTLYSSSLETWVTVGCECHASDHACKHRKVSLSDFAVAGLLDVWQPDESDSTQSYEPSDTCRVDTCELAKLKLQSAHDWHYGGTMHGEGYYDWWSSSTHSQSYWNMTKYIKALEWTDTYTDESDSEIHAIRKLTYIPCSCSSEYPTTHTLSDDEKLHSYSGICDVDMSNCLQWSLFKVRYYLDIEASDSDSENPNVWEEVASVASDFTCGTWENSQCVVPSSGNVVIVANRPRWMSSWGMGEHAWSFVTATTLHNTRTDAYRTIGCQCRYEYHECTLYEFDSEGYCIAGVLPVAENTCDCSTEYCATTSLIFDAYAEWYDGTVYGEGFIQHLRPWEDYNPMSYELFHKCLVCPVSESDSSSSPQMWYAALNCSCVGQAHPLDESGVLGANDSVHELAGVCTNQDCLNLITLKKTAIDKGWTWHDECILTHLAYHMEWNSQTSTYDMTYGDWYMGFTFSWSQETYYFSNLTSIYSGCAETPDGYYVVGCNCGSVSYQDKTKLDNMHNITVPSGFWWLIDFEGACNCLQFPGLTRELLMSYPSEFGLLEYSMGNDSKYDYTNVFPQEDMAGNVIGYTTTEGCKTVGVNHQTYGNYTTYNSLWIDYRCFCFIAKVFDNVGNEKVLVRGIYPTGSPADPKDSPARYENGGVYDSAEFNGHVVPFAHDNDIGEGTSRGGWDFAGVGERWGVYPSGSMVNPGTQPSEMGGYWSQEQAEIAGECDTNYSIQCLETWEHHDLQQPPLLTPNTSIVTHNCVTRFDSEEYKWYVIPKWWGVGYEYEPWRWQIYNVQWIYTNKGLLVRGVGGYQSSYTTAGSSYQECDWENWHDPDDSDDGTIQPRTITCPIDEDMHSCIDFDWDDGDDSENSFSE